MRTKQNYHLLTYFIPQQPRWRWKITVMSMGYREGLIPLPQEISAGCGLAWRMSREEYGQEKDRIEKSGIRIERHVELVL